MRSLSARRLTSVRTKQASLSAASSGSSRSARTSCAPSCAKRIALARPMPLAAPVITAAFPARRPGLTVGTEALARGAEAVDAELDLVPVDQKAGRFLRQSDAGGRAGGDDVTGQQRHELADVADERGHVEDEVFRRAGLLGLPVHFQPHGGVVDVGDLLGRCEEWAQRRKRVAAFPFYPLAAALELKGPLRVVVMQHVARDVGESCVPLDVARAATDDDRKLHLQSVLVLPLGMVTSSFGPAASARWP